MRFAKIKIFKITLTVIFISIALIISEITISPFLLKAQTSDIISPSIPQNLTATVISSTQINLSWSASTDNVGVAGYNLYRDGILAHQSTGAPVTSYSDAGLQPSTAYTYTVSAYDAAGNESGQSTSANAITQTAQFTDCSLMNIRCVDDTVGSTQEYSTIQACSNSAQAGDTCLVYPGIYDEQVILSTAGTSGKKIIFKSAERRMAKVTRGFNTNGKDYIQIEGFDITNTTGGWNNGGIWISSNDLDVVDNYIHDLPGEAILFSW